MKTRKVDVPEKFSDAAEFVHSFKLTKCDVKLAPPWELAYIIKRGGEEKIENVREYLKSLGGNVL